MSFFITALRPEGVCMAADGRQVTWNEKSVVCDDCPKIYEVSPSVIGISVNSPPPEIWTDWLSWIGLWTRAFKAEEKKGRNEGQFIRVTENLARDTARKLDSIVQDTISEHAFRVRQSLAENFSCTPDKIHMQMKDEELFARCGQSFLFSETQDFLYKEVVFHSQVVRWTLQNLSKRREGEIPMMGSLVSMAGFCEADKNAAWAAWNFPFLWKALSLKRHDSPTQLLASSSAFDACQNLLATEEGFRRAFLESIQQLVNNPSDADRLTRFVREGMGDKLKQMTSIAELCEHLRTAVDQVILWTNGERIPHSPLRRYLDKEEGERKVGLARPSSIGGDVQVASVTRMTGCGIERFNRILQTETAMPDQARST